MSEGQTSQSWGVFAEGAMLEGVAGFGAAAGVQHCTSTVVSCSN